MTKSKVIKVTAMQKKCLESLLQEQEVAEVGFREASRLLHQTKHNFWDKVVEFWPNAELVKHPSTGKWTVTIDE